MAPTGRKGRRRRGDTGAEAVGRGTRDFGHRHERAQRHGILEPHAGGGALRDRRGVVS